MVATVNAYFINKAIIIIIVIVIVIVIVIIYLFLLYLFLLLLYALDFRSDFRTNEVFDRLISSIRSETSIYRCLSTYVLSRVDLKGEKDGPTRRK